MAEKAQHTREYVSILKTIFPPKSAKDGYFHKEADLLRDLLRKKLRQQRTLLSVNQREYAANAICATLSSRWLFKRSQHIAFYAPVGNELDPSRLMQEAWRQGKTCYLPVCHPLGRRRLLFVPYYPQDPLRFNRHGIAEPCLTTRSPRPPWALDLVLMPVLGADSLGHRLGSGLGYYDRTFSYKCRHRHYNRPHLIGLAYDFQHLDQLPAKPWDVPLDEVIFV